MLEKMKSKLPGMKGESEKSMKPPSIEVEIGEEEGPEEEMPEEGDTEEVAVGDLAQFSDEELKAELEKRGMKVGSGGELPEAAAEGEPAVQESQEKELVPQKKVKSV